MRDRCSNTMNRLLCALLFTATVGCSSSKQCDLVSQLRARAGDGAIDCGYAALNGDPQGVDRCVLESFAGKVAFFARYDRRGKDSKVVFGIAGDAEGQVTSLLWDGDPSGGSGAEPVISGTGCEGPAPDLSADRDSYTTPPLKCTSWMSLGRTCG